MDIPFPVHKWNHMELRRGVRVKENTLTLLLSGSPTKHSSNLFSHTKNLYGWYSSSSTSKPSTQVRRDRKFVNLRIAWVASQFGGDNMRYIVRYYQKIKEIFYSHCLISRIHKIKLQKFSTKLKRDHLPEQTILKLTNING